MEHSKLAKAAMDSNSSVSDNQKSLMLLERGFDDRNIETKCQEVANKSLKQLPFF